MTSLHRHFHCFLKILIFIAGGNDSFVVKNKFRAFWCLICLCSWIRSYLPPKKYWCDAMAAHSNCWSFIPYLCKIWLQLFDLRAKIYLLRYYHSVFGCLDNVSCCGTFGLNTLWWFYFWGHHKLHWSFNLIFCVKYLGYSMKFTPSKLFYKIEQCSLSQFL